MKQPDPLSTRPSVLVIEDDPDIAQLLLFNLEREGFKASQVRSAAEGLRLIMAQAPDLLILDLMLPDMPGLELCRRLRQDSRTRSLPLLILTARDEEGDIVLGLELGADDYVTKPFSIRELISRVRALLRRSGRDADTTEDDQILNVGELSIDSGRFEVRVNGEPRTLTPAEFRLLRVLASRPGQVMTRDQLLDHITEGRSVILDRNVDVHIRSIRKKLGPAADCIITVRGIGYKCTP